MGSSGKNRGVAARGLNAGDAAMPIASNPARAGLHTDRTALEDIVEPEDEVRAAAAAECRLDTEEHAVRVSEAEAEAVVGLEIAQVQILDARRDLACVVEDRAVNGREDLPAVFGLQQQRVVVAKTKAVKAAKVVGSAERPLVKEGDTRTIVCLGHRDQSAQREDAPVSQQRDVLLQIDLGALERVGVAIQVVKALICEQVAAARARIAARLTVVDVHCALVAHEI